MWVFNPAAANDASGSTWPGGGRKSALAAGFPIVGKSRFVRLLEEAP